MFCNKCGAQINDVDKFCKSCGAPAQPSADPFEPQNQNIRQFTTQDRAADNICAILGLIFAFIFPIAGLVLSIIGMKEQAYHGLAVAGFVISLIFILLYGILIIISIASVVAVAV